jgi:hypothetical protein
MLCKRRKLPAVAQQCPKWLQCDLRKARISGSVGCTNASASGAHKGSGQPKVIQFIGPTGIFLPSFYARCIAI